MNDEYELQELCERGQERLIATDYLGAEALLVRAEKIADALNDYDTLARLYMPLQESRRLRRQRCGEGIVKFDCIASAENSLDAIKLIDRYPRGQLLIAGWGTVAPAAQFRELARIRQAFVETFLAAVYPTMQGEAIVLVPLAEIPLPPIDPARSFEALRAALPAYCIVLRRDELPVGEQRGDAETFARTMNLWERLHAPFLAAADAGVDPVQKIAGYRMTIEVDSACELAHQQLSKTAHELARSRLRAPV